MVYCILLDSVIIHNSLQNVFALNWRVAQFKPDVVFIMIGMNDCSKTNDIKVEEFEDNLVELTGMIDSLGAVPILQTTCPILPGQAEDRFPYFDSYMDIIRKVAFEHKLPLIDHIRFWEEHSDSHFFSMSNAFHPHT